MSRLALTIKTHEVRSINVRDWISGYRLSGVDGEPCFDFTHLPSGGQRTWFLCPACGRRCGVLYAIRGRYACRKCGRLKYESQSEPSHYRALRKAQKIRVRLGGSANMTEPFPERPRYMHRRTYQRLGDRYEVAVGQYLEPLALMLTSTGTPATPESAVPISPRYTGAG